jgi:type IV pilus assembly protein PilW
MIMMRDDPLKYQSMLNKKGVTLIELLVVLVICAIVIGGIYKVFIAQTRAYTVQDQVAEVQQDVRGAMEIMVRDIRMAGFQTNSFGSALITNTPIVTPLSGTSITVNYEYIPSAGNPTTYIVNYALDNSGNLTRTLNGVQDPLPLLSNVTNLNFSYGIDANNDGIIDGIVNGVIPDSAFKSAANVGTGIVFAVQITLTANLASVDPDVTKMVAQRTLTSVVTPRNLFFRRNLAY